MIKFQKIIISSILLGQLGCASLGSKDLSAKTDRFPANNADVVKILGVKRTPENVKNEELVGGLILSLQSYFAFCYEKELNSNPRPSSELFFYFGVDQKGTIQHITSETVGSGSDSGSFSQCISLAISKLRAPMISQDLTFRARLRFQTDQ